jgi:triosephosphate isomerase (TIM)
MLLLKVNGNGELQMVEHDRPVIIAGNWKMYKTIEETVNYIKKLIPHVEKSKAQVYLAVPFTAIKAASESAAGSNIIIGAQNMNDASEGAFTGEIAALMLKDAGAKFVIIGHSERRRIFHESNAFINKKIKRALSEGLQPMLCIGETLAEYEEGKTKEVLQSQLKECLEGIDAESFQKITLAYEPVWAIGTDKTATPEIAQEIHHFCRTLCVEAWGQAAADKLPILYGGSVKADNAKQLMSEPDVDGLLVGGASLSVESFSHIVNYQSE